MAKLSIGILGTGNIARQFADGVNHSTRCEIRAVGSRQVQTARDFASLYHIPVHGSYETVLAHPEVVAVYNSLPNSLHHEWTIKALRAGKHVLCEKPLAVNLAQAQEMFDVARREKRILVEAFMYRSHPLTLAVEKAVGDGRIGEIKIIRSSFVYATSKTAGNVRFDASLAGGSLMDIGCYCLSFSRLFAGAEPASMTAYGHLHESGVDDYAAGALKFDNGILATFASGMTVFAENTAYLLGTLGHIEIPVPWKPPVHEATFHLIDDRGERHTTRISAGKHLYALEADDFAATILDRAPVRVTEADSLGNQRCLDNLRRQIGLPF